MPKLIPIGNNLNELRYSKLESLACHRLYGKNKERNPRKRKVLKRLIHWEF